ncbi:MAG: FAD-binding protein, partial [Actinobacteria bacterium]|nr:FAD-binding protein [Actinomycetota bacterium]
ALRSVELGRSVLLVEKGVEAPGAGSTPMSGGVLHTCLEPMTDAPEVLVERIRRVTDGFARPDLAESYAAHSRPALDWLRGHGFRLEPFATPAGELAIIAPRRGFADAHDWRASGSLHEVAALQTAFVERGGDVRRARVADRLVEAPEGGVAGVILRDERGAETRVDAKRVILADGGFQADPELVRRHVGPHANHAKLRGASAPTGDALRMGLAVGAATAGMRCVYGHLLHRDALHDDRFWPAPLLDPLLRAGILVDRSGARIMDESRGGLAATNELVWGGDPQGAWIVVGETGWNQAGTESTVGLPTPAPNPTLVERGARILSADDLSSLAAEAGFDPVAIGRAVRDARIPIEPPYLAIPIVPGITFTMGGLAIDGRSRVLDEAGRPIPGLYAAGSCTGGLHGGPDAGYVGGLSAALVQGFVAAE